jgi:hypothetical protein
MNGEAFADCSNPALPQQFEIKNTAELPRQRVVEPQAGLLITGHAAGNCAFYATLGRKLMRSQSSA